MSTTTDTDVLLRAFVDELARCGMRAACTSPGSRNTPLVLALARERRLRCHSHVDERCAGFFALGLAKASRLPVAVTCTSGTAVAELLPAVIEAHEARVPLLVLSADRPPELRENGAGQAIDQLKIFGGAVKWFFEVGSHDAGPEQLRWIRTLACRAYWTALDGRPGAVHLNFPLREPLVSDEELPADASGRGDGRPFVSRAPGRLVASDEQANTLEQLVRGARRGVIVAGRHERDTPLGEVAGAFAQAAGWPLLADPLSGARRGPAAVAHYDALLREGSFAEWASPDLVVRVGDLPVSKPLRGWLAGLDGVRQIALDPEGAWQDPASSLSDSLAIEPTQALERLTREISTSAPAPVADEDWLASWRSADELAAEAILGVLGDSGLSEPVVAAELGVLLPAQATLFVASSMPVRDIETFWPVRADPPRALCNRGANGIDGTVSSAFGAAAAETGQVVLLIGDVALAHDIGGLLAARRTGLKVTIVLIDNGGGGIFDFLAIAQTSMADESLYTTHVATPTGLDFAQAAILFGLAHERAEDLAGFRTALERALEREQSGIVEVVGERARNVELHRDVWRTVSRALSPRGAAAGPAA
jgi:2-succinyl-5-enolpyruvyl-6-hydroxy-3-cyclohexene-1-carboxylate synthase